MASNEHITMNVGIRRNSASLNVDSNRQLIPFGVERVRIAANTSVKRDTTAGWASKSTYVPTAGEIIVYTDYKVMDGVEYPGIKVGDGNAYVADIPFIDGATAAELEAHIADRELHVTNTERDFWNNKLNYEVYGENFIFTRD